MALLRRLWRSATGALPRCAIRLAYCRATRTMVNGWAFQDALCHPARREGRARAEFMAVTQRLRRGRAARRECVDAWRAARTSIGDRSLARGVRGTCVRVESWIRIFPFCLMLSCTHRAELASSHVQAPERLSRSSGRVARRGFFARPGACAILPVRSSLLSARAATGLEQGVTSGPASTRPVIGRPARFVRGRTARGAHPDRRFA